MKTLFLHGMGARPKEWQMSCLLENNLEPHALHLNYSKCDAFGILSDYIIKHQIQLLIGRSHGGFLAYWLSEQHGIPSLSINPHFSIRSKKFVTPSITKRVSPLSLIFLGTDDELVDADRSLLFVEEERKLHPLKVIKTKMINGLGHWLDPNTFNIQIQWILDEIRNLNISTKNHE